MASNYNYAVPALDKCFEIMEYLATIGAPLSQSEISKGVNRSTNEIFRVLVNLTRNNYLIRDETSGKYRLSLKLYNLARSISPLDLIRQQALPIMENLAVETKLSCQLFVLYQSKTMVLVHARSPGAVSLSYSEGSCFSTIASNPGLLLLSHSKDEVRELIIKEALQGISDVTSTRTKVINDIAAMSKSHFDWRESLHINGVKELVGLVGRHEGKQIGALMISDISGKNELDINQQQSTDALLDAINKLNQALGF
ncbi:IclR family transcriptional regulator [Alteromonas macleodii]|uniref:IclR family transcriptional regulator n=1 Tax=Alteromonas macleodii TaxID=28108 RepID=UPI0020767BF6|nr:helix-turn-helix domain-containing protein [Alteromonas macleodii]USI26407.1 IclR family transcriptional regulator [Alteromonas macleodii]